MEEYARLRQRPFYYDMAVDNNDVYFSLLQYNALCKANLKDDQGEIINTFPEIPADRRMAYFGIYKWKNQLVLGPRNKADDFLVYDIESSSFSKIVNTEKVNFYSYEVIENEGNLYIVSRDTANVLKLDIERLSAGIIKNLENISDGAQTGRIVRLGNQAYIPVNKTKVMLVFDLEQETFKALSYPKNVINIFSLVYYDDYFYLTGSDKKIYAWDIHNEQADIVADIPEDVKLFYSGDMWFAHSFIHNKILYLFPCFADAIVKFDISTNKVEKLEIKGEEESAEEIDNELKNGRCFPSKYSIVQVHDKKAFFRSTKTRLLYELDLQTNEVLTHNFTVKNIYQDAIYPPGVDGIMSEGAYVDGLKILIETAGKQAGGKEVHLANIGEIIKRQMQE